MQFHHEYLLRRLSAIEGSVQDWAKAYGDVKEDIEGLLEEVLVAARDNLDFNAIAARLESRRAVDTAGLSRMSDLFLKLKLPKALTIGGRTIVPEKECAEISEGIRTLKEDFASLDDVKVGTLMHFRIGAATNSLLYAAYDRKVSRAGLVKLVREKLDLLVEVQLVALWIAVQKELDPEAMSPLKYPRAMFPKDWLKYESAKSTKQKLADYVVLLKPAILVEMARQGPTSVPLKVPDLADIVSWKYAHATQRPSEQEAALATSMQRLAALMKSNFSRDESDISLALGLDAGSALLRSKRVAFPSNRASAPALQRVCYEMRKVVELTRFLATRHSSIQTTIHQYKLGLEIMAPSITRDYAKKHELTLQREVARYLVERGIYAVGTKFGSHETDLVISEHPEHFVVEVKLYKAAASVTERSLKKALVQLQSYMDGPPTHPLGILLIFNCSNALLTAPRVWLRERYWIVVLNIQRAPPSARATSVTIEEGDDRETIRVHTIAGSRSKKKKLAPGRKR